MGGESDQPASERAIYEGDLRRLIAEVDERIDGLRLEIGGLEERKAAYERVASMFADEDFAMMVRRTGQGPKHDGSVIKGDDLIDPAGEGEGRMSQRQMILEVLAGVSEPQTPIGVAGLLRERFGVEAGRTSISSQMQKLMKMGKVMRAGSGWLLNGPAAPWQGHRAEGRTE